MKDNKTTFEVVVNGSPVVVEANDKAPLRVVMMKALEASQSVGQPPENWELRDGAGNALDLDRKIESYNFPSDVRLFLNLKAGVGGCR